MQMMRKRIVPGTFLYRQFAFRGGFEVLTAVTYSSEKYDDFQRITWRYVQEGRLLKVMLPNANSLM
jgi:hypothetical protein